MIDIKNLFKDYRKFRALKNVDLNIPSGVIFALLGPNGSGKTTLLKALLGIVPLGPGSRIRIDGQNVLGSHAYKADIGYMPQVPQFPPHLKVSEIIALMEALRGSEGRFRDSLIDELKIGDFWKKPFGELSGGTSQRVNILQCFMNDAKVFILDEPTAGLDPHQSFLLKKIIRERKKKGSTVLFTSHIMSEVEELAEGMALLMEGRIYTVTSPGELKRERHSNTLEEALHLFWDSVSAYEKQS